MKISARNMIKGVVTAIEVGAVNDEITVEIAPGVVLTSVITKKSCESLQLEIGKEAYVIIKASNVMLGVD